MNFQSRVFTRNIKAFVQNIVGNVSNKYVMIIFIFFNINMLT
jgi:hypothetical protein